MLFIIALEALEEKERVVIEKLYHTYSKSVKEMAKSILKNDTIAEDVVNDTFVKVIRHKDRFLEATEDECIRLIIICTRSICFDLYNRSKKIRFKSLENFYDNEDGDDNGFDIPSDFDLIKMVVNAEMGNYLRDAINKLPDPARDIVILKYYYEMKNNEIAEFYKLNPSTVGTIIQRSTKKLRRELERYYYDTDK